MEEARSLEPRVVKLEFCPQRMADEFLSAAFARLTASDKSILPDSSRGQNEESTVVFEVCFQEEGQR